MNLRDTPPLEGSIMETAASLERLRELLVYVAWRTQEDLSFGATKLNKALFIADFRAYKRLGKPITGATYWKLQHGPVPRALPKVRERLFADGSLTQRTLTFGTRPLEKVYATRKPDVSMFTPEQMALLDQVLEEFRGRTARSISDETHRLDGWRLAELREEIPYCTALLTDGKVPSAEAIAHGRELVRRMNGQG